MRNEYELTGNQRVAWRERVVPLFAGRNANNSEVARRAGFEDVKNVAGYLGEFRNGDLRGLRYFFGVPSRLAKVTAAIDATARTFDVIFREVKDAAPSTAGTLLLPGFEDWGPVALDDGFVLPPVLLGNTRQTEEALRSSVLDSLAKGVGLWGAPGSGVTTLLRRIATWAVGDGWRVTWGVEGGLPEGRAALLVIDGLDVGEPAELEAWAKAPGHALLHGYDGFTPWRLASLKFSGRRAVNLRLGAVDADWVARFVAVLIDVATRSDARRLRALPPARLRALLEVVPSPTPELVGCLLRASLDGEPLDLASRGARLVADAARRRLEAQRRRDAIPLVRDTWILDAYHRHVAAPQVPIREPVEAAVLAQVAELRLTETERQLLQAVLPLASGRSAVEALREADVLRESARGDRFRFEAFLAPSVAEALGSDPGGLRAALVGGRRAVLAAVGQVEHGPEALAGALRALDGPSFALAAQDLGANGAWLGRVRWDAELVARFLALLFVTGAVSGDLKNARAKKNQGLLRMAARPDLYDQVRACLGSSAEAPSVAAVRIAVGTLSSELYLEAPELTDGDLRVVLALATPHRTEVRDPALWEALPDELFPPASWVEILSATADGLAFLVDPIHSAVGVRILALRERSPDPHRALEHGEEAFARWLPLVGRLFAKDALRATHLLRAMLRDAVAETEAHAGEPADPREIPDDRQPKWHERVAMHLEAVALALDLPEARRHRTMLRDALREEMRGWERILHSTDLPLEPWEPRRVLLLAIHRDRGALQRLTAFCYTATERATLLRTSDGHLSPFWQSLVYAGVPFDDVLQLYEDVSNGSIPARPGRGAPSEWEITNQRMFSRYERLPPSAARNIAHTLLDVATADEIDRIPGIEEHRADLTSKILIGVHAPRQNLREWAWRSVRSLDEGSMIWPLLSDTPYTVDFTTHPEAFEKRERKQALVADAARVAAALQLVPTSPLSPDRWYQLANAALVAGVGGAALAPLLQASCLGSARGATLAGVLREMKKADPSSVRDWLVARLGDAPDVVDRPELSALWAEPGLPRAALLAYLGAPSDGRSRGAGLIPALVQDRHELLGGWLAREDTRDAALATLATLPDWPRHLVAALRERASVPPLEVLSHLLRQPGGVGLDVLDEASADWPAELRRTLWSHAAPIAAGPVRREVWRRLAAP